jgi:hypothetical protein
MDRAKMEDLFRRGQPLRAGERVLFWVPGGMSAMLQFEGLLAAALRLRGVDVHAVICDGPFIGCILREIMDHVPVALWQQSCSACKAGTSSVLDRLGIPYSFIGDFVPVEQRSALRDQASRIAWENMDELGVGDAVRSSVVRFLKGAPLAGHEEIVPEYAYSALVCEAAAEAAIRALAPSRVFMSHAIYVDWGPALSVALRNGLPVSAWQGSYLASHFYFRHVSDPNHIDLHNMSDEAWHEQSSLSLDPVHEAALSMFLANRYHSKVSSDMRNLHDYSGETEALRARYSGIPGRPVWAIMSHINWDSAANYAPMPYASFDEWMLDTIEHVNRIEDVNWLIKIHPAEAWDGSVRGVHHLLKERFRSLPPHVRLIPAEEQISPLDFFELVDGAVTVYGTSGLEIALQRKPVILAGEAHYGGKGFTFDGLTRESYHELLARAGRIGPLSAEQLLLAKKYAYTYFIRRQIPLPLSLRYDAEGRWRFQVDTRAQLLPGAEPFIDFVCDRLLDGRDFVMGDELVARALATSPVREAPTELPIAVT